MGEPDLEPLVRYWGAQDAAFGGVEPVWWGAVVSDRRYPRLNEVNYARVDARRAVGLAELEDLLLPALRRSGSPRGHVVVLHPEAQTELVVEASSRGERIVWDLVMEHRGADGARDPRVEEPTALDALFWAAHRESLGWFDIADQEVADQLQAAEREVLVPAGRRWFVARARGSIAALAALMVLDGVGYLDHVATSPPARRRGLATALTRRAVAEATASGAGRTYLLAEPDGPAAKLYERIGFRPVTQIASWTSRLGRER